MTWDITGTLRVVCRCKARPLTLLRLSSRGPKPSGAGVHAIPALCVAKPGIFENPEFLFQDAYRVCSKRATALDVKSTMGTIRA